MADKSCLVTSVTSMLCCDCHHESQAATLTMVNIQCRPACLRNVASGMTAASCSLVSVFAARRVCLLRLHTHRSHLRSYSFLRTDHKVRNPLWYRVCSVSARRGAQYWSEVSEMNRNNGSAYLQVCLATSSPSFTGLEKRCCSAYKCC